MNRLNAEAKAKAVMVQIATFDTDVDETGESPAFRSVGSGSSGRSTAKTGLAREDILSRDLPRAVDGMTPHGQLPPDDEDRRFRGASSVPSINPQIV